MIFISRAEHTFKFLTCGHWYSSSSWKFGACGLSFSFRSIYLDPPFSQILSKILANTAESISGPSLVLESRCLSYIPQHLVWLFHCGYKCEHQNHLFSSKSGTCKLGSVRAWHIYICNFCRSHTKSGSVAKIIFLHFDTIFFHLCVSFSF